MKTLTKFIKLTFIYGLFRFNLAQAQDAIRIYNWNEIIDPSILADFEKSSGIKVEYRTYSTDAEVEALFENNVVADIVFPSHYSLKQLISENKIKEIDRTKLSNSENISPIFWLKMQSIDAKNRYAVPYLWLITSLAINRTLIEETLGSDIQHSWALLFDEEIRQKLSKCVISLLDDPVSFNTFMLDYQGQNISNVSVAKISSTKNTLIKIKDDIKYINNDLYIDDLKANKLCLAMAYSGNLIENTGDNNSIEFIIPDNHVLMTIDTMVIPQTAQNVEGAYVFINYLLRPEVAAKIINATHYGITMIKARDFVNNELKNNKLIFPDKATLRTFNLIQDLSLKQLKALNQNWVEVM